MTDTDDRNAINAQAIRTLSEIRSFTPEGVKRYTDALVAVTKGDVGIDFLATIAADPELTTIVLSGICLNISVYATKYEMGSSVIDQLTAQQVKALLHADNINVWAWLDAQFRESLYPVKKGKVFVGDVLRHVVLNHGVRSNKATHRHLLRAAVNTVEKFGANAAFLMATPTEHTTFEEQIMSRTEKHPIAGSSEFVQVAKTLYCDKATGKPKRNTAKGKVGSLMRLIKVVGQLDVNYDAASFMADEIIALLPRHEFGKYLPA